MNYIYFDIETLPPGDGGHFERIRANTMPPANYKKQETIDKWIAEERDGIARAAVDKLALDGTYGSICCIGFAIDDQPVGCVELTDTMDERSLLLYVFSQIDSAATDATNPLPRSLTLVGHNIEFDARFVFQRAVRHGLALPHSLRAALNPVSGHRDQIDIMKLWAGYRGYVKLKDLAREILADDSTDIDGSEVARMWKTNPKAVVAHCMADVERVRMLHEKINKTLVVV